MDAVRYVTNRDVALRPAWKQGLEDSPAYFTVQPADTVDRPAAAQGKIRHIERLRVVIRILSAEGHELVERDPELILGIILKMLTHQVRGEPVKTGGNRSMSGEQIPGTRDLESHFEALPRPSHKICGSLQYCEGCVAFIQVANFRVKPQPPQKTPAANAQHKFLSNAYLEAAPV